MLCQCALSEILLDLDPKLAKFEAIPDFNMK